MFYFPNVLISSKIHTVEKKPNSRHCYDRIIVEVSGDSVVTASCNGVLMTVVGWRDKSAPTHGDVMAKRECETYVVEPLKFDGKSWVRLSQSDDKIGIETAKRVRRGDGYAFDKSSRIIQPVTEASILPWRDVVPSIEDKPCFEWFNPSIIGKAIESAGVLGRAVGLRGGEPGQPCIVKSVHSSAFEPVKMDADYLDFYMFSVIMPINFLK